ncbi:Lateral organ boundary [Vigna unguiculata]|uniref:Lateral organ boundary n=1 Tax=Vigna unguiculata TaxID=3917 RepID=A0A4D6NHQ0_VIGUN|nr:Lateral organ boundary [Vigna unguiculata]
MSMSSGSGGSGGGSSTGSPCGACKFLRRKCIPGCIFAPYFDAEQGTIHFATVHKVFGASNVSKLLLSIPVHKRLDAVITICYEAQSRLRDPVYGCVSHIFALQQQVVSLQAELSYLQGHLAQMEVPHPPQPPPSQPATALRFSMADLPSAATGVMAPATTYDLSSLFDPTGQISWAMQHRAIDPRQYVAAPPSSSTRADVEAVARDLPRRHGSPPSPPASSSNASPSLSLSK